MCPACNEPLVTFEWKGIEVDQCQECKGAWLDSGELEEIAERCGIKPDRVRAAFAATGETSHGKRKCVRCSAVMTAVTTGSLVLDHCPYGHGIWFDKGELAAAIKQHQLGPADFLEGFLGEIFGAALAGGP